MRHSVSTRLRFTADVLFIAIALSLCPTPSAFADAKSEARDQFEHAVKMRTMLEGYLPRDRALADYKQTIGAYHKVYVISAQAEEVTPSLIAEAELYREMGRQFDAKYFQTAIDTYNFLLKQYPGSRYRGEALFAIAQIQEQDQNKADAAEATFKDFLKRYPKNDKANDARAALKEIAIAREVPKEVPKAVPVTASTGPASAVAIPAVKEELPQQGPVVEPRESDNRTPGVMSIQTFNADDHSRIVVALEDTIQYDAAHLHAPDRIYFDLHRAKLQRDGIARDHNAAGWTVWQCQSAANCEGVLVLAAAGAESRHQPIDPRAGTENFVVSHLALDEPNPDMFQRPRTTRSCARWWSGRDRAVCAVIGRSIFREDLPDARNECFRVKLRTYNHVGAVRQDGDAPIAANARSCSGRAVFTSEHKCSALECRVLL